MDKPEIVKVAAEAASQVAPHTKGIAVGTGFWSLSAVWAWFGDNHYELAGFGIVVGLTLHATSVYIQWKRKA